MSRTLRYRLTRRARMIRAMTSRFGPRYVNEYHGPIVRPVKPAAIVAA